MAVENGSNGSNGAHPKQARHLRRDNQLPHDLSAEMSILGGILISNEALERLDNLEVGHFFDPRNQAVFRTMRNMAASGAPIDVTTLEAALERSGTLEAVGGIAYLGELVMNVPTADNVVAYAKIVRDRHLLRAVMLKAATTLERGYNWQWEPDELLGETLADLQQIERGYREATENLPLISLGAALEQLDVLARTPIYPTPFSELNTALGFGGALGGQIYTVVSGTGAGKTSWVATIAEHHASHAGEVLIATWEMIPGYFVARMAAKRIGRSSNEILRGEVAPGAVLAAMPHRMQFLNRPSLATLRRSIEKIMHGGRPAPLVVIDYIQALADDVAATMTRPDPRQVNALVSRDLLKIGQDTGAPMFVVSATARMTAQKLVTDVRKLPPRDLVGAAKETSQIEYDGAGLIVLSLSEETDLDGQIATMTVAKARFGETCHIDARYDGRRGSWIEIGRVARIAKGNGTDDSNLAVVRDAVLRAIRKHGPATSKSTLAKWSNKAKAAALSEINAMLDDGTLEFRGAKIVIAGDGSSAVLAAVPMPVQASIPEVPS